METATRKVVPGAPPPAPEKTKKRRKAKAEPAPAAIAPPQEQPETPAVSEPAPVQNNPPPSATPAQKVATPVQEVLHKRIRNFGKKIQRIKEYLAKDPSTLNPDQKKAIDSLPHLEGVIQELEEVKKALEPLETQISTAHAEELRLASEAADAKLQAAIASNIDAAIPNIISILSLLTVTPNEDPVLQRVQSILSSDAPEREEVVRGLVTGQGEFEGVEYTAILKLGSQKDTPAAPESQTEDVEEQVQIAEDVPVQVTPVTSQHEAGLGGSFHFMQASELEEQPLEAQALNEVQHEAPIVEEEKVHINGFEDEAAERVKTISQGPIDWAADVDGGEDDLPSMESLHAKFGTTPEGSGTLTPVAAGATEEVVPAVADDGFTAVGGGGAGRSRGSYRGRGGDGERGRSRGSFRGRGGHRGDGEFRGRGRGGFRGGERGGHRGAPRGRGGAPPDGQQ